MGQIAVGTRFALVDDADVPLLERYTWHVHVSLHTVYARGYIRGQREGGLVYMHRLLMGATRGQEVDHINGDGIDNRRANLRFCTRGQNNANRHRGSPHKGVHFETATQRWRAEIQSRGRRYKLGRFDTMEEAVEVYRAKAREMHGEFAGP